MRDIKEYLVLKVSFKIRKFGINWIFGDMADFKSSDLTFADLLKRNTKKVRVMLPPIQVSFHNPKVKYFTSNNNYRVCSSNE